MKKLSTRFKSHKDQLVAKILALPEPIAPEAYYQQAAQWRYELFFNQKVWLTRSLLTNAALLVLLVLLALKQVLTPYPGSHTIVVEKDKALGTYQVKENLSPLKLNQDWALTRYHLMRYVQAREQYHPDNLDAPFQEAFYMSAPNVRTQLQAQLGSGNPKSPYNLYGKHFFITTHVTSVNLLDAKQHTAMVEFVQSLHDRQSKTIKHLTQQAIVRYHYVSRPQPLDWAYRNPFHFNVTYYQTTQLTLKENH